MNFVFPAYTLFITTDDLQVDNTVLDVDLTDKVRHQVKIAQPTRHSVESHNLYSSLQMSQETLGQTVI